MPAVPAAVAGPDRLREEALAAQEVHQAQVTARLLVLAGPAMRVTAAQEAQALLVAAQVMQGYQTA